MRNMVNNKSTMSNNWAETFRPSSLEQCVLSALTVDQRSYIERLYRKKDVDNILLYGSPGTGKTSLARVLCSNANAFTIQLNGSLTRGIEEVRAISATISSAIVTGERYRVFLIDECDGLTIDAQNALKALMEERNCTSRFVMTCNDLDKVTPALQSRLKVLRMSWASPGEQREIHVDRICRRLLDILHTTNRGEVTAERESEVLDIVRLWMPDIRAMINQMQIRCG